MYHIDEIVNFPNDFAAQISNFGNAVAKCKVELPIPAAGISIAGDESISIIASDKAAPKGAYSYLRNNCFGYYGQLTPVPYCCGALVMSGLTGVDITVNERKVSTKEVIESLVFLARAMQYSTVQYITSSDQGFLEQLLETLKWKRIHEVVNQRTDNTLTFWQLDL